MIIAVLFGTAAAVALGYAGFGVGGVLLGLLIGLVVGWAASK